MVKYLFNSLYKFHIPKKRKFELHKTQTFLTNSPLVMTRLQTECVDKDMIRG